MKLAQRCVATFIAYQAATNSLYQQEQIQHPYPLHRKHYRTAPPRPSSRSASLAHHPDAVLGEDLRVVRLSTVQAHTPHFHINHPFDEICTDKIKPETTEPQQTQ
jgi:hypothetical protein